MSLLDEIIGLLSDESGSLNQALLKTKVLLHKIGQSALVAWVNDELNGYGDGKEVPQYRVVHARVMGNLANSAWRQPGVLLAIGHLSEEVRESLQTEHLRHSLAVLEQFVEKKDGKLVHHFPPEFNHELGKSIQNGWVESAWSQIEPSQVVQVLTEIRSRLLDFALELKDKVGEDVADKDIKQAAAGLDTPAMFAQSILGSHNTFGDNVQILVGHGNTQKATNTVLKGDFESLARELKRHGVAETDIKALELAVAADENAPELPQKKFGPAVRTWLHSMLGKAINLAWQVEVSVASGLLTNALQSYYFS